MHPTSLELLARQLADGLRGDHDAFCRELVRLLASGHPIAREHLATVLQMTAEQVAEVLAGLADIELDSSGNIYVTDAGANKRLTTSMPRAPRTPIVAIAPRPAGVRMAAQRESGIGIRGFVGIAE